MTAATSFCRLWLGTGPWETEKRPTIPTLNDEPVLVEQIDAEISRVLDGGDFAIWYLPVFDFAAWLTGSRRAMGLEALARFPDGLSPADVFRRATATGQSLALELTAMKRAIGDLPRIDPDLYLSLNASLPTVMSAGFYQLIEQTQPDRIVVEIPAQQVTEAGAHTVDSLQPVTEWGIRLAIDDTLASVDGMYPLLLAHPQFIKIDTAVIRGIDQDPARQRIVDTMGRLAATIDADLVAEGVHNEGLVALLTDLKVPFGQGFGLSQPQAI
ncbi:MAG: EAL domain-containing protein [Acidimicrobiia bacterium]